MEVLVKIALKEKVKFKKLNKQICVRHEVYKAWDDND